MVAIFEVVFLILVTALCVIWFMRTNIHKAHRRAGFADPGRGRVFGFTMSSRPDPPNRQSHIDG
jgi:hypothetical protein